MRGHRPQLKALEGGLNSAPPMPATLPAEMAGEWATVAADLTGRKLLTSPGLGLLEAYVRALWTARQAQLAINEHGVLVRSKDGALRPNPANRLLEKSSELLARLGYELGISPAGRHLPKIREREGAADADADPLSEFDV